MNELGSVINELGYRQNMDVNHLLNFSNENDTRTEVLSIDGIIDNMEGHSQDEVEVDDDTQPLEPLPRKESLKASMTLQNFLLQYEKATPRLLGALRPVKDEI